MTKSNAAIAHATSTLHDLPRDEAGPVFHEPWEAQAFAMTVALHKRGMFTWAEWATCLNEAIRDAQAAGDADHGDTYYSHWLTALERISTIKGLVTEVGGLTTHGAVSSGLPSLTTSQRGCGTPAAASASR